MSDVVQDHREACCGFTAVVGAAAGEWSRPTPCAAWDARGVVEHVIGFHDVLVLRPLGAKPARPRDDPETRWTRTVDALFAALDRPGALSAERASLLGVLTTEVLVHTWDLARAISLDVTLDPRLCQLGLDRATANRDTLEGSGMFAPAVSIADDAPVLARLLALFGRDPRWAAPG
jgi:uncharacterized protein (TIGR03086 family)